MSDTLPPRRKAKRGFAAMSPELRRRLASKGGKTSHERGKAPRFDSQTGSIAGKKGAEKVTKNGTRYKFNTETGRAAAKNRKGGKNARQSDTGD